jgi:hypothetical protein
MGRRGIDKSGLIDYKTVMKTPVIDLQMVNTDSNSAGRIWIYASFRIYFHIEQGARRDDPNPAEFLDGVKEAIKKAVKEGLHNITLSPDVVEGDANNLGRTFITLEGYRLETDAELKRRLEHLNGKAGRNLEEAKRQVNLIKYFEGEQQKYEVAVAALKPTKKKS